MPKKLTVKELLGFLSAYSNWSLHHSNGFCHLEFKSAHIVKKRPKKLILVSTKAKRKRIFVRKVKQQKVKVEEKISKSQLASSCDSLFWDNYDVEGEPAVDIKVNMR